MLLLKSKVYKLNYGCTVRCKKYFLHREHILDIYKHTSMKSEDNFVGLIYMNDMPAWILSAGL